MKILLIGLMFIMSGCTTYSVQKQLPDGSYTNVDIKSTRSFETPALHYERVGEDAKFDFSAQSVDNNVDSYLGVFQGMMGMMMEMMRASQVSQ
jgi:hypothetical protein